MTILNVSKVKKSRRRYENELLTFADFFDDFSLSEKVFMFVSKQSFFEGVKI